MTGPPALDLHAHVNPSISQEDLVDLGAVVFAVTRSLREASVVGSRADASTVWGVGCHPRDEMAQEAFSAEVFSELLDRFAFAGELGIDGKSRVSLNVQRRTLQGALEVLRSKPRITSIHSHAANEEVLTMLANNPTPGVILHWWLGSRAQTERACELGCYFSVNTASLKDMDFLSLVPLDRVFAETDHPFGDRSDKDGRPGLVTNVETSIGEVHRISVPEVRLQLWRNLATLVGQTRGAALLPKQVRNRLASL